MNTDHSTISDRVRVGADVVVLAVVTILAVVVASIGATFLSLLLGYDVESTPFLVTVLIASQLGMLVVGVSYARSRDVRIRISSLTRRSIGYIVGGIGLSLGVVLVLSLLASALDASPSTIFEAAGPAGEQTDAANPTILLVLSMIVLVPIEEYLFRGVIQGRLREALGPIAAILGASLLFGAFHLLNYTGTPAEILVGVGLITAVGAVFGVLYERTDNLAVPIVVHGAYNAILVGGFAAV